MSTTDRSPRDPAATGICLGPDTIRDELTDSPEALEITPEQAAAIAALPDSVLAAAIERSVGDFFWAAFDSVRQDAVALLVRELESGKLQGGTDTGGTNR